MNEKISMAFELVVNLFQGFFFVYFCHKFLGSRFTPQEGKKRSVPERVIYVTASCIMAGLITMINLYYEVFNSVEAYLLVGFLLLYSLAFLQGKIIMRIFICVFVLCSNYAVSSLMIFIMSSVTGQSSHELMLFQNSFYRYLLVFLVNVTWTLLLVLILRFRHHKFDLLKWTDWVAFIVIPVISLSILVMSFVLSLETDITSGHSSFLIVISMGIMIIAVLIWVMMIKIGKEREIERKYSLLVQQYQYQHENIVQSSQSLKEVSTLRHDMKNKLLIIGQLITDGKTDKAVEMCGACCKEIEAAKLLVNSDNFLLNAIINTKLANAAQEHIQTQARITTSNFEDIADTDLCVILGNLLDNALEAARKEPQDSRFIKIHIDQKGGYRSIVIKNSIGQSILKKNPLLYTTKKNKSIHGIGILSVRETVAKYRGAFRCYEEDGYFCCGIMLETPKIQSAANGRGAKTPSVTAAAKK